VGTAAAGIAYGNSQILPLIGGSGGAGTNGTGSPDASGGGGGAILIACQNTLTLNGSILARGASVSNNGSAGPASGGGIRLIANTVTETTPGSGTLRAEGGSLFVLGGFVRGGGSGRIRIEVSESGSMNLADLGVPAASLGAFPANTPARLWPDNFAPSVRIVSIGGGAVPTDPEAKLTFPAADVVLSSPTGVTVIMETRNCSVTGVVKLRLVPYSQGGPETVVTASFLSGTSTLATWQATVAAPRDYSVMQAWVE
jgi:hypothetical protein